MLPVSPPVSSETPPVLPPVRPEIPVSLPLPVIPLKSPPLLSPSVIFLSPSLLPVRSEKLLVSPPVKSLMPPVLPPVSSEAPCVFAGPGLWLPAEAANQLIRLYFDIKQRSILNDLKRRQSAYRQYHRPNFCRQKYPSLQRCLTVPWHFRDHRPKS